MNIKENKINTAALTITMFFLTLIILIFDTFSCWYNFKTINPIFIQLQSFFVVGIFIQLLSHPISYLRLIKNEFYYIKKIK
jgi:hypothetical protein